VSVRRMSAVWEYSRAKGSQLILLLAIADFADDLGVAWPAFQTLATKTRMSHRQTIRLVQSVAETGELWVINRLRQRSNLYCVTVGLNNEEIGAARTKIKSMGGICTMGSDKLTLPPQVLEVVTSCHYLQAGNDKLSLGSDIAVSLGSDIAVSHDPSLTIMNQGDIKDTFDLWSQVLADLALQMDKATFDAHLRGTTAEIKDDGSATAVTVFARSRGSVAQLDRRLRPVIERNLIMRLDGGPVGVRFVEGNHA
jgi:hypothetical protein